MSKLTWYIFFFALFAVIGFTREFFFVNLNNILFILYYKHDTTMPVPESMHFFLNFSYDGLYYSKYLYTLISTAIYFLCTRFALLKLSPSAYFLKILNYAYLFLLGFAALSMLYGYFIHGRLDDDEYTLSRWLLGIAQSPIICFILLASAKLYPFTGSDKT